MTTSPIPPEAQALIDAARIEAERKLFEATVFGFQPGEFLSDNWRNTPLYKWKLEAWLAARSLPVKVTDEMVERALHAYCCPAGGCAMPRRCAVDALDALMKKEVRGVLTAAFRTAADEIDSPAGMEG